MISRVAFVLAFVALFFACQGKRLKVTVPEEYFNVKWTYNESKAAVKSGLLTPSQWKKSFSTCDPDLKDSQQSPININTDDVPLSDYGVLPLVFSKDSCPITLRNIGSTLTAAPTNLDACKVSFTNAAGTKYKFYEANLHWHQHWDHRGTEHTVNGQGEAVEAHLLHYNAKFKSLDDAFDDANMGNIAVVSIRYTVAPTAENATEAIALDSFIANTYLSLRYMDVNTSVSEGPMNPYDLIGNALPRENLPMFHYNGSLTVPRCDPIVSWYIVQQTVMLSKSQVHQLRFFSHVNQSESERNKLGFNNDANIRPTVPLSKDRVVCAWPRLVPTNHSSDSAISYPEHELELWQIGAIVGGSVAGAALIAVIIAVSVVKCSKKDGEYASIINASA